jgi:hypothetical protein
VLLKIPTIGGSGFEVGLQWASGTLLTPAARMPSATQDENVPGILLGWRRKKKAAAIAAVEI